MRRVILISVVLVVGIAGVCLFTAYGSVHLVGHSMEPTISDGDIFFTTPPNSVTEGDVILFDAYHSDQITSHRVVNVTPDGYVTKGDANNYTDQAAGIRYIEPDEVRSVALQISGHLVVLPNAYDLVLVLYNNLLGVSASVITGIVSLHGYTQRS